MLFFAIEGNSLFSAHLAPTHHEQAEKKEIEYKFLEAARGITKEGIQASFQTYQSSDGETISIRTEFFRSVADMESQFVTTLKGLAEIITSSGITDDNDNVIGRRISGKAFPDELGQERYCVIWTHSNEISYIESKSLNHALDFEKKFYTSKR